jgi:hypothetical protein
MPNVSKYSPEKEAALIEALEELGGYGKAARRCRISAKTFQRWRMDYPEFGERCTAARDIGLSAGIDEVETKVFEVARNPKHPQFITAAIFLLKSHNRKVYGDKQQIEHSGADGGPLVVTMIRDHVPGDD